MLNKTEYSFITKDLLPLIDSYQPLADGYNLVAPSKRKEWLVQAIAKRSSIADDTLIYYHPIYDLYFEFDIKANEIITGIRIFHSSGSIAHSISTIPNHNMNITWISNPNYINKHNVYVRGIQIYGDIESFNPSVDTLFRYRGSIRINGRTIFPAPSYDDSSIERFLPSINGIVDSFEESFPYPDGLTLYYNAAGANAVHIIFNECFAILYELATLNHFWMPETYYMLGMQPKKLYKSQLLPAGTKRLPKSKGHRGTLTQN